MSGAGRSSAERRGTCSGRRERGAAAAPLETYTVICAMRDSIRTTVYGAEPMTGETCARNPVRAAG
jgi:hypothetical protein